MFVFEYQNVYIFIKKMKDFVDIKPVYKGSRLKNFYCNR